MKIPAEVKPAGWGAVCGAIAIALLGFTWGGWVTGSTAKKNAQEAADAAVVAVLAPICADNFHNQTNAALHLAELKNVKSWERDSFIAKGGWATMPGTETPAPGVAGACARLLSSKS